MRCIFATYTGKLLKPNPIHRHAELDSASSVVTSNHAIPGNKFRVTYRGKLLIPNPIHRHAELDSASSVIVTSNHVIP